MTRIWVSHSVLWDYLTKPIDWDRLRNILGEIESDKNQPTVLVVEDNQANS